MWWAGVAWLDAGYEVAVLDGGGGVVSSGEAYGGDALRALVEALRGHERRAGDGLGVVVDSTGGVVDGHLSDAGLKVFRADPWLLPARTGFGSAPALELARRGLAGPLPRLTVSSGSLVGRDAEYAEHLARCVDVERELTGTGQFLVRGPQTTPTVAITFDDGPDPRSTPLVLDILREHQVKASFFCVGINAAAYPDLVARAAAEGHLVGNHTWSHPFLPDLSRDELLRQVDATNGALADALGHAGRLFRPPYGSRTPEVLRWLAGHGMTTVLWDVDAGDWAEPGVEAIAGTVTGSVRGGSVVLMHDGGGDRAQTVAALPEILGDLLGRGYTFVTIEQLVAA